MRKRLKTKIVIGAAVALVVAGGGAAVAATKLGSPSEESKTIVNDAAKQLGVQPQALTKALKKALENRVDAAVAAGEITKEQATEMKARIEADDFPILGGFRGHHGPGDHGHFADLAAAATYVGLTQADLRTELMSGKSLADIAKSKGKSVDGLVSTLVTAAKKQLDEAVAAGRLTKAQADQIEAGLKDRITALVNGQFPARGERHGFGGPSHAGPPPAHDGFAPFGPRA